MENDFIKNVSRALDEQMKMKPYPINLLEEVHMHDNDERKELSGAKRKVCENAHTRILGKILAFNEGKGYILLNNLLKEVAKYCKSWNSISTENPIFTSEASCDSDNTSGRIDLLIKEDGKYAIIVENKINEATDQNNQIARYIKYLEGTGFTRSQVFVLYMSSRGDAPSDKTWKLEGEDYQNDFAARYCNFSYRFHVLPWLKKEVLPTIKDLNQPYLKSAVEQYIDYLEGKYALRKDERECLLEVLKNELKINDDEIKKDLNGVLHRIDEKISEVEIIQKGKDGDDTAVKRRVNLIYEGLLSIKTAILGKAVGHFEGTEPYTGAHVYERKNHYGVVITNNGRQYVLYIGEKNSFFCSVISYPLKNQRIDIASDQIFSLFFKKRGRKLDWRATEYDSPQKDYLSAVLKMKTVLQALENNEN